MPFFGTLKPSFESMVEKSIWWFGQSFYIKDSKAKLLIFKAYYNDF